MGRVAQTYFVTIPGAVRTKVMKNAAGSRLFSGMKKALPSILIGMATAAVVRYIAESRLMEPKGQDAGKPHSKRPVAKGEPATNGHQKTHPDRLASFSEGTF